MFKQVLLLITLTFGGLAFASTTHAETDKEAARFLMQSTFGPTMDSIQELKNIGSYEDWIDDQINNKKQSLVLPKMNEIREVERVRSFHWNAEFINRAIKAQDQLRQRMQYALSQILVLTPNGPLVESRLGAIQYFDMLGEEAFGNFEDILYKVSTHPAMANYLTFLNNKKADPDKGTHPDENYAREVMQLFSIGLNKLRKNGHPRINKKTGNYIPTYSQDDIMELARVFTGWVNGKNADYTVPMKCRDDWHDFGEKTVLGKKIPAGLSCEDDVRAAVKILFNHKNTPIFISKQLIQKFTTSNPSGKYVKAVANAFKDNGNGVRGDLKAVIKAILLHPEARKAKKSRASFGKIKEPFIRMIGLVRAANGAQNPDLYSSRWSHFGTIGQGVLSSPSVFNYFRPEFTTKVVTDRKAKWVSPELQIATDIRNVSTLRVFVDIVSRQNTTSTSRFGINTKTYEDLVLNDVDSYIEQFNLLLFAGGMLESTKFALKEHLNTMSTTGKNITYHRIKESLYLMMTATEQNYQR